MGLVGELLPFLVAVYLLDCLVRVAPGQALFASLGGRRFRLEAPGWRWAGLLPASESFLAASLGLRADASGVFVRSGHEPQARLVRYEDMDPVSVRDGRVHLGRGLVLRPSHPTVTRELAALVEKLRLAPGRRRLALLRRALRRRCDLAAAQRRRDEQAPELRLLKTASAAAFLALFGIVPASLIPELPWRPSPLVAAGFFGLSYLAVIMVSVRVLRGSGVCGKSLASRLLPLILFPPAAAHAPALVARETFLGFEPWALAAVLLDPQDFRRLELRMRRAPLAGGEWSAGRPRSEIEAMTLELVTREARRAGLPELEAPRPSDASAAAFCPACYEQYRSGFDHCADCGVTLERFAVPG